MIRKNNFLANNKNIDLAVERINNGEVIIYPTDTLYSFGADATNSKAIEKLNQIKKRISPLSIILSNIDDIKEFAHTDKVIMSKIKTIFPGPYTALLKSKNNSSLSKNIQSGSQLIGIRIINNAFCNNLIKKLSKPIVTTSVNMHKQNPLTNVDTINNYFKEIDFFHNDQKLVSKGSTIIDFSMNPEKIVRFGEGIYICNF